MKRFLVVVIVIIQLSIIIYLAGVINYKLKAKGPISLKKIEKKDYLRESTQELPFFYEPTANHIIVSNPDWLTYTTKQTINSDSLNERYNYPIITDNTHFRIIILGDSFTGAYVNTSENWTELLEDYLNQHNVCKNITKYEVINLGVDGYDLAYETERFEKRGIKYNPDLVILLVTDILRLQDYRLAHQKKYSEKEMSDFKKKGIYYPGFDADSTLPDVYRLEYQEKQFRRLFSLYSGPLLLVDHEKNDKASDFFLHISSTNPKLTYIKTDHNIYEKSISLPDGHPNKEGHFALMKDIAKQLSQKQLLPCR